MEDEKMQRLLSGNVPLWEAVGDMLRTMGEGGLDITPLKNLILEVVDEEKIRESPMELYIKTFSVDEFRELDIDLKTVEPGYMKDLLLASAYIYPLFKNEKLHGRKYIDGGSHQQCAVGLADKPRLSGYYYDQDFWNRKGKKSKNT